MGPLVKLATWRGNRRHAVPWEKRPAHKNDKTSLMISAAAFSLGHEGGGGAHEKFMEGDVGPEEISGADTRDFWGKNERALLNLRFLA